MIICAKETGKARPLDPRGGAGPALESARDDDVKTVFFHVDMRDKDNDMVQRERQYPRPPTWGKPPTMSLVWPGPFEEAVRSLIALEVMEEAWGDTQVRKPVVDTTETGTRRSQLSQYE